MIKPLLEEEMIDRLKQGENPMDLSIEKYERLLEMANNGERIDGWWVMSDCCPLCHEYICYQDEDTDYNEVPQCPLEIYGDCCQYGMSSWAVVRASVAHGDRGTVVASITYMINQLKYIKQRMTEDDEV